MAASSNLHLAQDKCLARAKLSFDKDTRQAWLTLFESYQILLRLDGITRRGLLIQPVDPVKEFSYDQAAQSHQTKLDP